jgi:pimeloyl-ACP methyl ester carboxylesterase
MLPAVFSERFIREELASLLPALTGNLAFGFDIAALFGQVSACMDHDTTDRLHRIATPTLVLTGTADRLVSPRHSDLLAARIPGARLVHIPDGSHGLNLEMADAFNTEVLRFLAAHPLNGGS